MKNDENYRFGFTSNDMEFEINSHKGINRAGCFVPTRKNVLTMPVDRLYVVLDLWLYESPATLIPSDTQIAEVLDVILLREDVDKCEKVIRKCKQYIGLEPF